MTEYVTIAEKVQCKYEVSRSEFIAEAAHVTCADQAAEFVAGVRKKYFDATHNCYAWIIGETASEKKFSDDGEPQGTAGMPILNVLEKRELTFTAVVVTRYFGGIKLGAGGLVRAYSESAARVLTLAGIRRNVPAEFYSVMTDYATYSKIEGAVENADTRVIGRRYEDCVELTVATCEPNFFTRIVEISAAKTEIRLIKKDYFCF